MKKLMVLFLVFVFSSLICADPAVSGLVISDADGVISYGTTYNFNATVSGITNESIDNITACSINGVAMVGPGGNGSGNWEVNTTINSFGLGGNCTYTTVTVTCTQINGSSPTMSNSSWTALPCVEDATTYSALSSLTQSTSTFSFDISYIGSLNTYSNVTPETANTYCSVSCRINDDSNNVTVFMPVVSYNSTHNYCPYVCQDTDSDTILVTQGGFLGGEAPTQIFTSTDVAVMVIGLGSLLGGAGYLYGRRRK